MVAQLDYKQRLGRILYFFPFQLVLLHFKRNHFLLAFWVVLFAFTTQSFANKFGIPYLFLAPEYKDEVGIWSYGILGFSLGGFIMAFNIYSYIIHSKRFPFLGTLARPFFKFCINNFIIPLFFIAVYIYFSSKFLKTIELKPNLEIFKNMVAFILGNALFISIAVLYFFPTNKNIFKITGRSAEDFAAPKGRPMGLHGKWFSNYNRRSRWRVDTYLTHPFKINLARDTEHYDAAMLRKVFYQNHVNASLFELIIIISFFLLGALQFHEFFVIPAAASAFLVMTMILMVISILMSWFKGWTLTTLIAIILLTNYASTRYDWLNMANPAYGIDYSVAPIPYTTAVLDSLNNDVIRVKKDLDHHKKILEKWLAGEKKRKNDPNYKPKLIVVNTSGGGLRSALWALRSLQYCDSISNGLITKNTRLISGSSGGMIGAAYFRDLYLNKENISPSLYSEKYLENISTDILNRVLFTFATNDIFIRFRHHQIDGKPYVVDRGMTFEDQLNINTQFVFNKPITSYSNAVERAEIPMMIFAPSIVNDGRRMLISSQPLAFLCHETVDKKERLNLSNENIEFRRMFSNHNADNLLMSSALRMNATFPYILPYPSLPTEPSIEVMDAGLRDNFGMKITTRYIAEFKDWINENTSGLIILQIRDTQKHSEPNIEHSSIIKKIINPIGSFYGNYFNDQDYNMDQLLHIGSELIEVPIHHIPLELRNNPGEHIALSWHLTALEKLRVTNAIEFPWNQKAIQELIELLND